VCRREGFGVEALTISVLRPLNPGPYQLELPTQVLIGFTGVIQIRYEGCLHRRSDEEHEEYPPQCSPNS